MMRRLIACVLFLFTSVAGAVQISPVSVLFSGTMQSYDLVGPNGLRADLTPFLSDREISGRIDFYLFPDAYEPHEPGINREGGYSNYFVGNILSISLDWSGGTLNPSDYPGAPDSCANGMYCAGGDDFFLRRDAGAGEAFTAGDRMYVLNGLGVVDYSEVLLGLSAADLFGGPGAVMSLEDLYNLPGPVDGSGTFRQSYSLLGGNGQNIVLGGYEGTFRISNAIAVPEPGTLALFALGLAGIALTYRSSRRVSAAGVNSAASAASLRLQSPAAQRTSEGPVTVYIR